MEPRDPAAEPGSPGPASALPGAVLPYLPVVALLVLAAWVGRKLWFFSDDWNIFAEYHTGNLTEPFNGHLSAVPAGIYQLLFHTAGVGSYLPYRLAGLAALGVLGFQLARWSSSWVAPWVATLAVVAVMWNSSGASNVMFPFLMNFSLPIAALLAIWWHLDQLPGDDAVEPSQHDGHGGSAGPARHLVAIGLWLALALATSGLGVMAAFAVAVELLLRRAPLRQWIPWGVPVLLWGIWWLGHRGANDISTDVTVVVPYAARMLLAGPTAIAAGNRLLGALLTLGLVAAVGSVTVRDRQLDPRVASALSAAVAFAGLTALTRQDTVVPIPPDELRYGWTIGAYLVFAALAVGIRWARPEPPRSTLGGPGVARLAGSGPRPGRGPVLAAGVVAAVLLVLGAVDLLEGMRSWATQVADAAPGLRSNIYSAEALGVNRTPADAIIGPLSYVPVSAQDYLSGVAAVGSPLQGSTGEEIGGRPEQRREADDLLFASVGIAEPTPEVTESRPGSQECTARAEIPPGVEVELVTDGEVGPNPHLELGRFGASAIALAVPTGTSTLSLPEDAPVGTDAVVPYRLSGSGGVGICLR